MSDNNNLQELFDSFGLGLKKYIRDEVKQQVTQTMASMDMEEEDVAVAGVSTQSYLDDLAELAKKTSKSVTDNSVIDDLISKFAASDNSSTGKAPVVKSAGNGDYLQELARLSSSNPSKKNSDDMDALLAMGKSASADVSDVDSTPSSDETSVFSEIQGFLNKIRQRKNLISK